MLTVSLFFPFLLLFFAHRGVTTTSQRLDASRITLIESDLQPTKCFLKDLLIAFLPSSEDISAVFNCSGSELWSRVNATIAVLLDAELFGSLVARLLLDLNLVLCPWLGLANSLTLVTRSDNTGRRIGA